MNPYTLKFSQINMADLNKVGGKALNLGKLSKISGIEVPPGFCITTGAFSKALENNQDIKALLEKLERLSIEDREEIIEISSNLRKNIEFISIPDDIENEILNELSQFDFNESLAVRSSATAEDLPTASFAGQQDSYLNIRGRDNLLYAIKMCWASLFTERAIFYRIQHGFEHKKVKLAVVVQKMVLSDVSGIMFTANPMTSDRSSTTIDAGLGLGEAMVSGVTNPDIYTLRKGKIIEKTIGKQDVEIVPLKDGGTEKHIVSKENQRKQVLKDREILELYNLGQKIQDSFGCPQDIEWCYEKGMFYIVQSRAITTLFPIPTSNEKETPRVYFSIGHTQMMTDAIRPLGMSFFEMISEISLTRVGGRLYADATHDLSSSIGRKRLIMATGKQDLLIQGAIKKLLEDKEFRTSLPKGKRNIKGGIFTIGSILETLRIKRENNPDIIDNINFEVEKKLIKLETQLAKLSAKEALHFISEDRKALLANAYHPKMLGAIIAAILASDRINKNGLKWLGEENLADSLSKSLKHNGTTEMGLALCDLADKVREYPEVFNYLSKEPEDDEFFDKMRSLQGGEEIEKAFNLFFSKYGMRCPGEIDITKPRFSEKPTQLLPILLNNISILKPGEHLERFRKGEKEAIEKEKEIITRLEQLPGGKKKAKKLKKDISVMRNFLGCREYPKYYIVRRYDIYKKTLLKISEELVTQGILKDKEDIYYLYFNELENIIDKKAVNYSLINLRKNDFIHFETLSPPRVITSDGMVPNVKLEGEDFPENSLVGIPVSAGVIEGRARVVLSVEDADLKAGDILITRFTDPSWTSLFATITGLVTEVGGFTTHGAVVAREYGLPGVVGVENATKLIKDGQLIRLDGSKGYIEIL